MNDIFKRFKCDLCGKTEYKKYIGTEQFDGGYTTINKFEPSDYIDLQIGKKYYKLCPKCVNDLQDYIDKYKQRNFKSGDSNKQALLQVYNERILEEDYV